ncbi:perlucin-like protein [Mercenaria mercenaria]|uniref:perlucin-like protein n=1 Tax=Mercenaria mercenaria TaxID=6596 RepID=UPI001E1DDE2B|nr:perlucin-like protein [Mercenaria mercenaria]
MAAYIKWCIRVFIISSLFANALCCPSGWMTHGSSCYHFSHDTEDWIGALQFCRELKGQLVEINDASENTFLEAEVKLRKNSFWIALSDVEEESTWIWMNSRQPLRSSSFNDWIPGQPDNYGADENCACIYSQANYQWNDYPCHENIHYICEMADDSTEVVG